MSVHSTKMLGSRAEDLALVFLQNQGLILLTRNYKTPGRGGGEIDLIMLEKSRASETVLLFIEVRARDSRVFGGAAASIQASKRQHLIYAAKLYLQRFSSPPPCRFDVVLVENRQVEWIQAAFDAS